MILNESIFSSFSAPTTFFLLTSKSIFAWMTPVSFSEVYYFFNTSYSWRDFYFMKYENPRMRSLLEGKKTLCTVHYFWYLNYFALEVEMYLGKKKIVPCLTFLLRPLYWDNVLALLHFCHTALWIFSRMKSGAIAIFYPCQTSTSTWFLVMQSFDHWFIH